MSTSPKRTFATPGSRSFTTPAPSSSRIISGETFCRRTLDERLQNNGSVVDDEGTMIDTPRPKNSQQKRPMTCSSGYTTKKKAVILTTPDDHNILYTRNKIPVSCSIETDRSNSNATNTDNSIHRSHDNGNLSELETSLAGKFPDVKPQTMRTLLANPNTSLVSSECTSASSNSSFILPRKKSMHSFGHVASSDIELPTKKRDESMVVDQASSGRSSIGNRQIYTDDEVNDTKSYMSAVKSLGKIGIAYYDTENCQINMMEDVIETENYHFLKLMKRRIQPNIVITSAKQEEGFLQALREEDEDENSNLEKQIMVEVIPCMMFGYEICKRRILTLNGLSGLSEEATEMERNIYYGSLLSFDNINMVRATGALLKYLDKNRVGVELEDPGTRVPILSLKSFSMASVMMIDDSTYGALQIFSKESHPSAYKSGGSGSKEGLSLFGMMNYTKSGPGAKLLSQWFLHPLTSIDEIQQRHDTISFFLHTRNLEAVMAFQDNLKHVKNINRILSKMLSTGASISDWRNLYKAIYNAICIGDACRSLPQEVDIVRKISNSFSEELYTMANLINKIIDFEESASSKRFVVKPGIDDELDERKRTYNGLPDLMTKVASEELKSLDESITECGVSYLPQLGYLLTIPVTEKMKAEQKFDIDGLEFVFFSDDIVHYKTAGTRELDQLLGDTQSLIFDHETAIMYRLQNVILENSQLLLSIVEFTAELDCFLALTTASREGNYIRPELTEHPILTIKGGRHPIQELCTSQFVPNDVAIETDSGRIKIITGPNSSGKSIYLKQVGLTVFLAQIGCFVPAESAVIGISDRLFTRIHAKETVSTQLSTFMIDLNQISAAVHNATEKSLVLIDEFGKGTSANDGLSLLAATLMNWLSQGAKCPRVFVSTHFHGLIRYNLLPDSTILHYQTMEVMEEEGDLVFLYHLKDGHTDSSHALHVAATAGIDESIIKRAEEVSSLISQHKEIERISLIDNETKQQRFGIIAERFLDFDLENGDVVSFLEGCVQIMNDP